MEKSPIIVPILLLYRFTFAASSAEELLSTASLDALQEQLNYTFASPSLLVRALTHSSFSLENNRPLALLGLDAARASASLRLLLSDHYLPPEDLSRRVSSATSSSSCAADASRLSLDRFVRVSPGTEASSSSVLCGALRGIVGAVAMDSGNVDAAGDVFLHVHRDLEVSSL